MPRRASPHPLITGALLLLLAPSADAEDGQLLAMLQGQNLEELRSAVVASGGEITHELPIIDALGVRMSRSQLEMVRQKSSSLYRVIDDLAYEPEPQPEAARGCGLAGSLELTWRDSNASWKLFNKDENARKISAVELTWPAVLGEVRSLSMDGRALDIARIGERSLHAKPDRESAIVLEAGSSVEMQIGFANSPASAAAIQSEITLQARAGEDCSTDLVPSYSAPDSDSYFPSVSGAALLHSHGVTGKDVAVAVLDSGLWEHPSLARSPTGTLRVTARYDAIADREVEEAFDESGHGTHMTSVLARSEAVARENAPRPSYRGIAPGVDLVIVKAFDSSGEAGFLDIVRGVQWVVENREKFGIRVLNLSFSARPRWPYWQDPVNQALMRAWQAGIFIVAAAGNEGPEPMTVGSPGNLPYLLTVGAITDSWTEQDRSDDYIPDFSSRGPTPTGHIKPDVVAAGGHMAGLVRPGSALHEEFPEYRLANGDFVMTGTSQAAAVVSGIAALLLELEPELSNTALKCMLMSSAEPAIEADGRLAYSPFKQGNGLVNVQRALTLGDKDCANSGLDLKADVSGETHFEGPAQFSENATPTLPGESELVNPRESEAGASETRRWGAAEHLQRISDPNAPSPIDWRSIFLQEQRRVQNLSRNPDDLN